LIKGRACRCEKAKAHREFARALSDEHEADILLGLFYFERTYGEMITANEVEDLLSVFGNITYCRKPSKVEQSSYNLGEGVVVQFELYDEGQAALQVPTSLFPLSCHEY
jgi:hypothetical protein